MAYFGEVGKVRSAQTMTWPQLSFASLGDQAVLAYCANEAHAARLAHTIRLRPPDWLLDIVIAYSSVAFYYDLQRIGYHAVTAWLKSLRIDELTDIPGRLLTIPCCYELGPDLDEVARARGLSVDEVIRLHTSVEYHVYAIGFCPGFPYLGYLPNELCGIPRLPSPRLRVEVGSVGLTGRQSGIYTLPRPGGWPIIGRTPMTLVDLKRGYFALQAGDRVRFETITPVQFSHWQSSPEKVAASFTSR